MSMPPTPKFHFPPRCIELTIITILSIVSLSSSISATTRSLNLNGSGGGTVTSDPPCISCTTASCSDSRG